MAGAITRPEWTPAEEAVVRRLYGQATMAAIAAQIGRTSGAVGQRAFRMGLTAGKKNPDWSADDVATLRAMYPVTADAIVADHIGRSIGAVRIKARALGLTKSDVYRIKRAQARRAAAKVGSAAFHQQRGDVFGRDGVWTPVDDAVRFLQRIAPIHKCDDDGTFNAQGECWRFGARVLDADGVKKRAARAGWVQP